MRGCEGRAHGGFDLLVARGLAVSSWGCGGSAPNLVLFRGKGDGTPLFADTIPGQIWAADVAASAAQDEKAEKVMVAVGTWRTEAAPAQLVLYSVPAPAADDGM